MQKIIAIQANSVDLINIETDTTLQLALEAQKRSYQIYWYETKDLNLVGVYSNPKEGRILQYPDNRVHLIDVVYFIKRKFGHLRKSDESLELKFFPFNALPNLIVPPAVVPIQDISVIFS